MTAPGVDRRDSGSDRRTADRRVEDQAVPVERRRSDRRMGIDRRLAMQSAAGQIQIAMGLLLQITEMGEPQGVALSDEQRRLLDTALLRLRFAVDRMERD